VRVIQSSPTPFRDLYTVPHFVPTAFKLTPISANQYQLDFFGSVKLSYWKDLIQFVFSIYCPYFSVGLKILVSVVQFRDPALCF